MANIGAGESLSLAYYEVAEPTWKRRDSLLRNWRFACDCPRCMNIDPASFRVSLCAACKEFALLHEECAWGHLKPWVCSACGKSLPWEAVRHKDQQLAAEAEAAEGKALESESTQPLEAFMQRHRIPEGHYLGCRCHYVAAGLLASRLSTAKRFSGSSREHLHKLGLQLLRHVDGACMAPHDFLPKHHIRRAELLHFRALGMFATASKGTQGNNEARELLGQAQAEYILLGSDEDAEEALADLQAFSSHTLTRAPTVDLAIDLGTMD